MRISTLATQSFPQSWFTKSPSSSPGARAAARRGPRRGSAGSGPGGSGRACGASQARQTVGIRVARSTTERLVWHCGEHTLPSWNLCGAVQLVHYGTNYWTILRSRCDAAPHNGLDLLADLVNTKSSFSSLSHRATNAQENTCSRGFVARACSQASWARGQDMDSVSHLDRRHSSSSSATLAHESLSKSRHGPRASGVHTLSCTTHGSRLLENTHDRRGSQPARSMNTGAPHRSAVSYHFHWQKAQQI